MATPSRATLVLADGTVFSGTSFGSAGERCGEVVFNTAMTGYQEVITDPSYHGQLVTMTYPQIGNYGVNLADRESLGPQLTALLVKEVSPLPSSHRAEQTLPDYLVEHGVVAMAGFDTRELTRRLRVDGAMMGILSTIEHDAEVLLARLEEAPRYVGADLVSQVTCAEPYGWSGDPREPRAAVGSGSGRHHVVCLDCGVKFNSLRELAARDCRVSVVPASTRAADIMALQPDGVYLSNGPGDPEPLTYVHQTVRDLMEAEVPLFGICLGHQMLSLAVGASTFKLKFGHRGGNQPVQDLETGKVEITSQNHGFAVDPESLEGTGMVITHQNLNDRTVEGMRHEGLPVFSVQYHPEASPGPHDSNYLFDRFLAALPGRA